MRHAFSDLIVTLGNVGGTKNVADIAHLERFAQIHAQLEIVSGVQRRDAADSLRAEARTGAVGGADVERHADKGDIVFAHFADVFQVRRFEERVDAGPVRQLATLETTDLGFVFNGIDALQAEFLAASNFLLPLSRWNLAL